MTAKAREFRRLDHHGVALMLVVFAIALATVMGIAILASTSMDVQVEANTLAAAQSKRLAESGVNLGIYYLQHPASAPTLNSYGYYPGQNGISLGADVPGTINVAVTNVGTSTYDVSASATATGRVTRSIAARVEMNTVYEQWTAASFNGSFVVPASMTITGDVRCDGVLTLAVPTAVSGVIYAGGSNALIWDSLPSYPVKAAPLITDLNIYKTLGGATPTYQYVSADGILETGTAQELAAVETGTPTAAPTNPKNVWYANSSVTLTNFTLNGTIVIRGAGSKLIITDDAQITAQENMPAVVVENAIQFATGLGAKSLNIDGICWIGAQPSSTTAVAAANCQWNIDGALLTGPSVNGVSNTFGGTITVTYDAAKATVPNLTSVGATPSSVKILRWGN